MRCKRIQEFVCECWQLFKSFFFFFYQILNSCCHSNRERVRRGKKKKKINIQRLIWNHGVWKVTSLRRKAEVLSIPDAPRPKWHAWRVGIQTCLSLPRRCIMYRVCSARLLIHTVTSSPKNPLAGWQSTLSCLQGVCSIDDTACTGKRSQRSSHLHCQFTVSSILPLIFHFWVSLCLCIPTFITLSSLLPFTAFPSFLSL